MSNVSNFCKTVMALLKGDDAAIIAVKVEKKAKAAFKQQIAALETRILEISERLDDARETFKSAVHVTSPITDTQAYLQSIVSANEVVESLEAELAEANTSLEFFNSLSAKTFA
jgi:predicted  nucleic acid-binding Zn-ribbon protein